MKRSIIAMLVVAVSLSMSLPALSMQQSQSAQPQTTQKKKTTQPKSTLKKKSTQSKGTQVHTSAHQSQEHLVTIPADTVFHLKMNQGLSSKTAKVGDTFTATVTQPVVVGDGVAVPESSIVRGKVTTVTPAARRKNATIAVSFNKLELPSGRTYQIVGSLVSLEDEKGQKQDVGSEGEVKGKSTTKRNVIFIGGGAGAGAAIGAAAGGGKGAGIGAAIGAGAGVAGALLSKGHEVEVASGTEIGMALDHEVKVAKKTTP